MRSETHLLMGKSSRARTSLDAWCLAALARGFRGAAVRIALWDGTGCNLSEDAPVATLTIRDRPTLLRMLAHPALAFGEAYTSGRVSVDNLTAFLETTNRALAGRPYQRHAPRFDRISRRASADNVHTHYDLGNDFYRLWLDEAMVYTCAYFERPDATLEQAQRAKLDLVCRKLRLQPGDRVIEAGCGWGALAIHMAREYGVLVRAFNISRPQLEYARARAAAAGVSDRVSFIDSDYRSIDGRCDAFVSVGMLEHVGRRQYAELGGIIARTLDRRRGRALLHFIGRNRPLPMNSWIARHIFPGAYAPALGEVLPGLCEAVNLSVLDVENLRLHYAQTIRHWRARFEVHAAAVADRLDESFVRTWRLYLAGAQASFVTGDLQLFQVTLGQATDNDIPWTREAIYRSAHARV